MRLAIETLFVLCVGATLGLGMTYYAVNYDAMFGATTVGSWSMQPTLGTANANPYARASIARFGRLPIALGDGVMLITYTTDDGKALDGRCDVVIAGTTPAARFWTLTLYNPSGAVVANSLDRYAFTSQEIVRNADGSFTITVGPLASPGNWLPSGGVERYLLVLCLYDTPVGVATKASHTITMPSLTVRQCP